MILTERPDGIRIIRVDDVEEALPYRATFAGAYQDIFSESPYNERFYPSEAEAVLNQHLESPGSITLLAVKGRARVVGFGMGLPALRKPDIAKELRGLLPVKHTFYLSELGVLSSFRRKGLGRELTRMRLQLIDHQRYTHAVNRASATRDLSYNMFMAMGFDDIGVYMEVPSRRMDGRVSTDRRLFMAILLNSDDFTEETGDPTTFGTASPLVT